MDPEPLRLVYIAGTGRAGSTLLELLLHAHPRMASCGELQVWPREITVGRGQPCGCGVAVTECPFWSELRARVDPLVQPEPRIHHFRKGWRGGHPYRPELLARLLARDGASSPPSEAERTYAENNARVLEAYAALWGERHGRRPRWLIDSSKDPYRLWWLLRSPRLRVSTVHLVRDPRGYVRSAVGVGRRPLGRRARLRGIVTQAAVWALTHHLVEEVLRRHAAPSDWCVVAYEDLAREPEVVLRKVCATLGCDFEPSMVSRFREGPLHTISGNRMRFERRGIALDESWREALTPRERAIVRAISRSPPRALRAALRTRAVLAGGRGG